LTDIEASARPLPAAASAPGSPSTASRIGVAAGAIPSRRRSSKAGSGS
jgi:hypothetical protein